MRLEIDAGNTRVKWRYMDGGQIRLRGSFEGDNLAEGFADVSMIDVTDVWVTSVRKQNWQDGLVNFLAAKVPDVRVCIARSTPTMGDVAFSYVDVSRLGVDRCLAMVAAYRREKSGVLVIDAGSAITADYVDGGGRHLGGYILPGFSMLKRSLLGGTDNIRINKKVEMLTAPGKNTEECVEHGRYLSCRSLLQGLIAEAEGFGITKVLLTGGDGDLFGRLIDMQDGYVEDLVFEGLSVLFGSDCRGAG